jgi:serine/threonine protein kinase
MEVTQSVFRKRFTYDPVKDLLGKGGFGEVYKAYDNEDQLFVALKIAQGTTDDKYNLINEIKRFKKLNHPNIVKHIEAYEVNTGGTDIHGNPIIHHVGILEYADQGTFADLLKKGTNYRQIEDLAKDIIDGLAYLHSEGIIHRDLKPTNILLFSEGEKLRAKITDFGIAKRTDATAASTQLVGTVEYMAPEYFTTGNITPASDVWSVGVMLLEALTGTHPFGKTSQGISNEQIIANILNKDISTAAQNVTEPLKGVITRCFLRETNLRPQSANKLKGLLLQKGDAYAEKTQVIRVKSNTVAAEKSKSKWKRWVKALFDFDVMGGKWRKVLAREFILILFNLNQKLHLSLTSCLSATHKLNARGKTVGIILLMICLANI